MPRCRVDTENAFRSLTRTWLHSFDLEDPAPAAADPSAEPRRRVLVTGAAGRIGSYFAEHSHHKYDLRLTDIAFGDRREALGRYGELLEGELHDLDFLKRACSGMDTLVHMAGNPDPTAVWTDLLEANIIGTYQACVAAIAAGCRRIIYASSIHAVSGYPPDVQVKTSEAGQPGRSLRRDQVLRRIARALSFDPGRHLVCRAAHRRVPKADQIRARDPANLAWLNAFVSRRDLNQLINRCIDAPAALRFAVFHGLSNNPFKRLDISDARELVGYAPQDDFAEENAGDARPAPERGSDRCLAEQHDGAKSGIRDEL